MVGHQMAPPYNPTQLVMRLPSKHLAQVNSQLPGQLLSSTLRYEHDVVLAVLFLWFRLFILSIQFRLSLA
jgi:hypothetical protein